MLQVKIEEESSTGRDGKDTAILHNSCSHSSCSHSSFNRSIIRKVQPAAINETREPETRGKGKQTVQNRRERPQQRLQRWAVTGDSLGVVITSHSSNSGGSSSNNNSSAA